MILKCFPVLCVTGKIEMTNHREHLWSILEKSSARLTKLFDDAFFVTLVDWFDVFGIVRFGIRLVRFTLYPQVQRFGLNFTDHRDDYVFIRFQV